LRNVDRYEMTHLISPEEIKFLRGEGNGRAGEGL
jgi:hypothetical protein